MGDVNKVFLVGKFAADLEIQQGQRSKFLRTRIAVDKRWRNKQGAEQSKTDFISLVAFGQSAEYMAQYGFKGGYVTILGSISTGSYEKEGRTIYTTDVMVDEAIVHGPRTGGQGDRTADPDIPF